MKQENGWKSGAADLKQLKENVEHKAWIQRRLPPNFEEKAIVIFPAIE